MLALILRRIHDSSEQALDYLKEEIATYRIVDQPGENVEEVARTIKSIYTIVKNASTDDKVFVPDFFCKMIYRIFQTSSVKAFNAIFASQVQRIQVKADMEGLPPVWPSVKQILSLAIVSYRRFIACGE